MAKQEQKKPNILILWGDDIGMWNVSRYSQGMMGSPDPQHRPHRRRRGDLHRLLRPAELHCRPRVLHHAVRTRSARA